MRRRLAEQLRIDDPDVLAEAARYRSEQMAAGVQDGLTLQHFITRHVQQWQTQHGRPRKAA
ncbi:hypothetical protein AB0O76_36965 [Streptomyces sp. NPDC086554]|uniref:hypothetical protein n=1 Tax=Streptomyces sp. NPDC086554 TaxID=3154864 RepID=UPI00342796C1